LDADAIRAFAGKIRYGGHRLNEESWNGVRF